ncbi:MAG: multidrug MFS transporter [Clostridium sp.]|nr:multidrug MFS transporter [Clostridium sp.]
MVLVTIGTHEQQFDRLIRAVDGWNAGKREDVLIQTGYSGYEPKNCRYARFMPYSELMELMERADRIITHGGPASFLEALRAGKIPVVVPRQARFGEHVNDHQVKFARLVEEQKGNIIVVEDTERLAWTLDHYKELAAEKKRGETGMAWNNEKFVRRFEELVNGLWQR